MVQIAGADLRAKFENPLKFQWGTGGAEAPPSIVHGFDVTLLIDVSNAIIAAEAAGTLPPQDFRDSPLIKAARRPSLA
jgi:hypothetical protein